VRENVSSNSKMRSLLISTEQTGVETEPGTLPAVKETVHVIPMKSSSVAKGPSIVRNGLFIMHTHIVVIISSRITKHSAWTRHNLITYL